MTTREERLCRAYGACARPETTDAELALLASEAVGWADLGSDEERAEYLEIAAYVQECRKARK